MAKVELGVKRTCPNCGARFYDLGKSPAECPKCDTSFDPEVLLKPRRARPEERKVAVAAPQVEEDVEVEELEEEADELEEAESEEEEIETEIEGPELDTETEEEEEPAAARKSDNPHAEEGLTEVQEEEDDEDVEDDDVEIEEIEDEEEDVSGILDADLDKEEP